MSSTRKVLSGNSSHFVKINWKQKCQIHFLIIEIIVIDLQALSMEYKGFKICLGYISLKYKIPSRIHVIEESSVLYLLCSIS